MRVSGNRRKTIAFGILGVGLVAGVVALNISWIIVNWRQAGLLLVGILVFPLIVTGVVLNTIFLIREVRRNEQHEAFINAVTHELKTPVASTKLYLQTLLNRQVDEPKRLEFYRAMIEDNDRLLGTIEQVLRAGQLRARVRPHRTPVDVSTVVQQGLELARTRYHLAPEALTFRETPLADAHPLVMADEEEMRAVVSNLLDNAIKYSGNDVHVTVELEQTTDRSVTLRVQDRGVGMSPSERKRIFKRFYRIPGASSTRFKGTGLGLYIVRATVARWGGKVFAESAGLGQGSTFTVQLPVVSSQ